jgi:hypothetical protein
MTRACAALAVSLLAILGLGGRWPALAQSSAPPAETAKSSVTPRPLINDLGATLLVRTLLVALHQAAITGNYSVLRDLGTPQFRVANTPLSLAEATQSIRAENVRLDVASLATPVLLMPPHRDEEGRLRLYGFMPTKPEQVLFDLRYLYVDERWMIQGMRVKIGKVPPKLAKLVAERGRSRPPSHQSHKSPAEVAGGASTPAQDQPPAKAAVGDLNLDPDAVAAFGRHLGEAGLVAIEGAPPVPVKAKR